MAEIYLGLGANLGDRLKSLETAIGLIHEKVKPHGLSLSSVYETPALLPKDAPSSWNLPYYNLVLKTQYSGSPHEFLGFIHEIESRLGRVRTEKWEPRPMDIDILHWEGFTSEDPDLIVPHPEILKRAFVSTPLAELHAQFKNSLPTLPRLMGILNLTPDSFSDGGVHAQLENTKKTILEWDAHPLSFLDLGAESTRPHSTPVSAAEEWSRLAPVLEFLREHYRGKWIRPKISVDTYKPEIAIKALELGADVINDVNGLKDPAMVEVLKNHSCKIVLMHSLSVPADPKMTLPESASASSEISHWFKERLQALEQAEISKERIILDPGIGFGKTALQSTECLQNIERFQNLGCELLVGHSRKSFLTHFSPSDAWDRDPETLGTSFALLEKGVDILRVHNPSLHHRAFLAWQRAKK